MIPASGLVIASLVVFDPILHLSRAFQIEDGIYSLLGISLLVITPTIIIGYTLTALNTFILKVFEGYVFLHRFQFMQKGYAKHAGKLIQDREELRARLYQLALKKRLTAEEKENFEKWRGQYYDLAAQYDQTYPPPHVDVMPTKFGNILKASEAYAVTRYGIDSVQFWPRLWHVIPPSYQQTIENARGELSFLVNMSALSIVFFFLCAGAILLNAPSPNHLILDEFLANSIRYILAGGLAFLANRFFNRAALLSVGDFGMMIRSAYDLFRLDLLEQFQIKRPKNSNEEYEIWQNLGQLIVLGPEAIDFSPLRYQSKKTK